MIAKRSKLRRMTRYADAARFIGWATATTLMLVAILRITGVIGNGVPSHPPISAPDGISIILTAVTVILAALTIILAIAAIWGYNQIQEAVRKEAVSIAAHESRQIARPVAETVATRVAEEAVVTALHKGAMSGESFAEAEASQDDSGH